MQIEGRVGPQAVTDGAQQPPRLGHSTELVTQDCHGRYHEAVYRGNVFTTSTTAAGIALVAANASPLALNTGIPVLGLYNPPASGKNLSILKCKLATVSGTPGGGFVWNVNANQASNALVSTFTATQLNNMTFAAIGSVAKNLVNTAMTASTVICTMLRPIGGPAAIAAGAGIYSLEEETAGEILVVPGNFLGIACVAVGTTHVVSASITWEEIPV